MEANKEEGEDSRRSTVTDKNKEEGEDQNTVTDSKRSTVSCPTFLRELKGSACSHEIGAPQN